MDGLAGTIGRPILTSAGIEPHHFGGLAVIKQVTLVFPPLKRADLLMGDPFMPLDTTAECNLSAQFARGLQESIPSVQLVGPGFPAWECSARQAPLGLALDGASETRSRASWAVRSQAELGNEGPPIHSFTRLKSLDVLPEARLVIVHKY